PRMEQKALHIHGRCYCDHLLHPRNRLDEEDYRHALGKRFRVSGAGLRNDIPRCRGNRAAIYVMPYRVTPRAAVVLLSLLVTVSCGSQESKNSTAATPQNVIAELISSDPTWGNTEGPAVDSKGNLFFCARGAFKGI